MTGLKILAWVVLALFLLSLVRLGGGVKYSRDGLYMRLRFGRFSFVVYPRKEKEKKEPPKPTKGKSGGKPEQEPEKGREHGGPLELVKRYLPLACEAAGELKRKIRVDTLWLELTMAGEDAAAAAMAYGYANMALGMLWPLLEQNFEIRDPRVSTRVDFETDTPTVYINAALSLRLGQLVSFVLRFGWKFLRLYLQTRPRAKSQKEAI